MKIQVRSQRGDQLFGYVSVVSSNSLRRNHTRSCGCLHRELLLKKALIHGHSKDGFVTKMYVTWASMKARCNNINNTRYKDYGGRGIKVCKRWNKFENFLEDMVNKPEGLTLDRINNNGNYEPENCRWATPLEQVRNGRVIKLTKSKVKDIKTLLKDSSLSERKIAKIFDVSRGTISCVKRNNTWKDIKYESNRYVIAPEGSSLFWLCDFLSCAHGGGLVGRGVCSARGEWYNPKCPEYISNDDYEAQQELKYKEV